MMGNYRQEGLSLVELVVALAMAALILPMLGVLIYMLQFAPDRTRSDLSAQQDLRSMGQWIATDGNRATSFATSSDPDIYGTFSWTEYGDTATTSVEVVYSYDSEETALTRTVNKDGELFEHNDVARNIAVVGDVTFTFTEASYLANASTTVYAFRPATILVTVTSTVDKVLDDEVEDGATLLVELRSGFERVVADPGNTPVPVGSVATEDWESGDFDLGFGWADSSWTAVTAGSDTVVTRDSEPHDGTFHVRLRDDNGLISRTVDLRNRSNVHLTFFAKVTTWESGDTLLVKVAPDGVTFTTVKTFTSADSDDTYTAHDIDLSSFSMTIGFVIAFDAEMSANDDLFFIDNIFVKEQ